MADTAKEASVGSLAYVHGFQAQSHSIRAHTVLPADL